jgi:hypothetical protein
MKNIKQIIKKIKTSLKLKRTSKKKKNGNKKKGVGGETSLSSTFLNEYNRNILKRYNRPIARELPERKRIFTEVREVLNDIESRLRNGEIDD